MRFLSLCVAVFSVLGGHAAAEVADSGGIRDTVCESMAARQERLSDIPRGLLSAISLAETGRWDETDRESFAWPWTVTARGEGRYYASKAEALRAVEKLQADGVRNIDVGCMQINLLYHGDAFVSVSQALDPAANVAYAAEFLTRLHDAGGTWDDSAAKYHSSTPEFADRYREKVSRLWEQTKGVDYASLENAAILPDPSNADDIKESKTEPAKTSVRDEPKPIDWERTATLNARFAERRARSSDNTVENRVVPMGSVTPARVFTASNRSGRSASGGLTFAAKRQRQLADWRAWARAQKSSKR